MSESKHHSPCSPKLSDPNFGSCPLSAPEASHSLPATDDLVPSCTSSKEPSLSTEPELMPSQQRPRELS